MPQTTEQVIGARLSGNDTELDSIAKAVADPNQFTATAANSPHLVGTNGITTTFNAADGLDTGELFAVTRATQKIENEDQILPISKNKQNEIVRGAIEQMKRQ